MIPVFEKNLLYFFSQKVSQILIFYREFGPAQDYVPTRQFSLKSFGGRPSGGASGGADRKLQRFTEKPRTKQDLFTKILTIKVSFHLFTFV